jgi:conjugal transfer pilus assembly protein TraV
LKNAKALLAALCLILVAFGPISCGGKFACKEKIEGIKCESISSVYEKEMLGKGADGKDGKKAGKKDGSLKSETVLPSEDEETVKRLSLDEKRPVRVPPKVIRVWIAPWEDADGDLHQPEYIYSEITDQRGRWSFGEKETSTSQPLLKPVETSEEEKPSKEESQEGKKPPDSEGKDRGINKAMEKHIDRTKK